MNKQLDQLRGMVSLLVPLLLASQSLLSAANASRSGKPNVIITYSDDRGYTDLGRHGLTRQFKKRDANNDSRLTLEEIGR
jgi:hypothetical protein